MPRNLKPPHDRTEPESSGGDTRPLRCSAHTRENSRGCAPLLQRRSIADALRMRGARVGSTGGG